MCRNIRPLFNFDPPATMEEINHAATQFVRKISGFTKPSQINEKVFIQAIEEIAAATQKLISNLETDAPQKNREEEAEKKRILNKKRFG